MTAITPEKATHEARVEHQWYVYDMPPLTQKQSGRRVTIRPSRITITANRTYRDGMHVLIEGQTSRQNGTPGQHRRGVAFVDNVSWSDDVPMTDLPAEYQLYLDAARRVESTR